MKYQRGFLIRARKELFKPIIITITDGENEVVFNNVGSFIIETEKPYPEPIIKKD